MNVFSRGIILAGDSGNKLEPLTLGIPKQLLPLYDKPMIYYPIELLVGVGVKDILIITSQEYASTFNKALGDGSAFGVRFEYAIQPRPEGAAQAFTIGEEFVGDEPVCLITGDCILLGKDRNVKLQKAMRAALNSGQASIFVCRDWDPNQYGVVTLDSDGKCITIEGKTTNPLYYSITGLYVFPKGVADYAKHVGKSERGRLEVTSLNKAYFEKNKLQVQVLGSDFKWFDTNSFDSLLAINNYIKNNRFK
jgi:glucose-1-phosphate thymidylyltransferase